MEESKSTDNVPSSSVAAATNHSSELNEFLKSLKNYTPTLPDPVSKFYLERNGLAVKDDAMARFVSLAADKLMCDIIYGAKQRAMLRKRAGTAVDSTVLEVEDLEASLTELKVFSRRKKQKL